MVDGEAIQSAIRAMPLLRSTCKTVHCLGERALFSSSFGVVSSEFLSPNVPITPYNIRYWGLFLSQGNRWIKYRAHPKIRRPKPYQLTFAFLVTLIGFHPLLSTQLTADLTLEYSDYSFSGGPKYTQPNTAFLQFSIKPRHILCSRYSKLEAWNWNYRFSSQPISKERFLIHDTFFLGRNGTIRATNWEEEKKSMKDRLDIKA